jgi:hypothetical protein
VSFANFSHSAGLNANLVIFAYRSVRGGGEGGAQTKVFNFGKFVVQYCVRTEGKKFNMVSTHAVNWLLPWTNELCRTAYQCLISLLISSMVSTIYQLVFVGCE